MIEAGAPATASRPLADLTRANLAIAGIPSEPNPVRIVHLGLGAFHRAHQAWYTQHAGDGWGIAAFTGRSPRAAETLAEQDGVYALVARSAGGDAVELITSISEARDGADLERLVALLADPDVGVVTLTITEAGYHVGADGELDCDDPDVQGDIRALRRASSRAAGESRRSGEIRRDPANSLRVLQDLRISQAPGPRVPVTPLGRLLWGLRARRAAASGPIAVVSCDNIPANGATTRRALVALAAHTDEALVEWIERNVSFVSTSVDRITPAHDGPLDAVVAAGWRDRGPVVTEPFADWVLEGDFPAGRPAWHLAGARFVDDIGPWEDRKLWLLNGAHTILAAAGPTRGHVTVSEAFADPTCRALVDSFWDEAVRCLPAGVEHVEYRRQLAARFANTRIVHRLEQIGAESAAKVRFRLVPIARGLRARGEDAAAAAAALAEWICRQRVGGDAPDREGGALAAARRAADPVDALLRLVAPDLADDRPFVARVRAAASGLSSTTGTDKEHP